MALGKKTILFALLDCVLFIANIRYYNLFKRIFTQQSRREQTKTTQNTNADDETVHNIWFVYACDV